jgi:hypothetical protein
VHGDGTLWCWGGLGRFQDAYVEVDAPVRMGDADDWAAVSTDADFTCGLRRSGALWCGWLKITEPVVAGGTLHADGFDRFGGERLFASVTLRNFDVFAIDREGALWSWSFATKDDPPTPVGPGRRWSSVSFDWLGPGRSHHCAIDANRALWCWGDNGVGQLGDGSAWRVRPERIVLP